MEATEIFTEPRIKLSQTAIFLGPRRLFDFVAISSRKPDEAQRPIKYLKWGLNEIVCLARIRLAPFN